MYLEFKEAGSVCAGEINKTLLDEAGFALILKNGKGIVEKVVMRFRKGGGLM